MDWIRFCQDYGIAFEERGPSVKRGNINIRCPFCPPGHSKLMGLELGTRKFACWKAPKRHGGQNAAYLIQRLIGCSEDTAREIAGMDVAPPVDELMAAFHALESPRAPKTERLPDYRLPSGCFPLRPDGRRSGQFLRYLRKRGLPGECVERYGLHGADRGEFRGRVVVPIADARGRLVGATGRAIGTSQRRHHTMPAGVGTRALIFEQLLRPARLLVITEGPYDAMTLDWAAHSSGLDVAVVPLAGLAMTPAKRKLLETHARRCQRTVLLLDSTAVHVALDLQAALACPVGVELLPRWAEGAIDDAGELGQRAARDLLVAMLARVGCGDS